MTRMAKPKHPQRLQEWIEARRRFRLSDAHVQMARELGLNPNKLDNHTQEPWKAPLPQFIEALYFRRLGKERPEVVMSIEKRAKAAREKKAARKEAKRQARTDAHGASADTP